MSAKMRLSIVIPARNEERFLPEQLLAIQEQSVQPDEVILVNDGSTDQTRSIMDIYCATNPDIDTKIIDTNERIGIGVSAASNLGVASSTGDLLWIASANDVMQPGAIQAIADARVRFSFAHLYIGDIAGLQLGWTDSLSYLPPTKCASMFGVRSIIHGAGAVISRAAWDEFGGWSNEYDPYIETLMWHTVACRYGVVYVPTALSSVRKHEGSISSRICDASEWRREAIRRAVDFVLTLEEPTRTRLVKSKLWEIREWAPDMIPLLRERVEALS